ncbi:double C2-like domain-containing protein beta isoform X1 [Zerene cesonia]|uniref:double C2-like domain-containing protein beta isoform X1 n=1 Tax=Zerene cesonia TaxID=33412 RepID=UPI0018E4FCE7|nr:double C2-like domain-containing protein beta isoform X1 [Zerene cesonia]
MNYQSKGNKYVCPNDRQLSLRAKLRTGWSAARSEPPLTTAEREAIAAVVKRAEKVEETEARRIGRLVARLEGMRRSAQGPAPRSCVLCGETPRLLAPLRICFMCRNAACPKCVIDTPPHKSPIYAREQYMCNLCAETREMWKKSGAWFFKSLPKYILPERKTKYNDTEFSRSLQEAGNSSNEGKTDSEPSSPLSLHAPSFSRQPSNTDSRKSVSISQDSHHDWSETEMLTHGVSGLSLHRTDSVTQRSMGLKRTGSKGSAYSLRSVRKDSKPTNQVEKPPVIPDAGFGTLEIKLAYDNGTSSLAVTVLRARGLIGMDMTGLSDPFCRLEILPIEGTYSNRLRTKTVHKTKHPEFNETLHFFGITESDLGTKSLEIVVFDDDRYGCDEMGSATVSLRECIKSPAQLRLALSGASNTEPTGPRLLLALCYSTKRRALAVTVCRAAELPPQDSNGYSDPFVKLHLDPDPYHKKHKTSIKWRNLNPVWNEGFFFETRLTELSRQNLTLTVWDKDYGKPNDFLGSLVLGSSSKGRRLKHWMDCIKFPDHRHEQWHSLTDTQHI